MLAYEKALDWQEVFEIAIQDHMSQEDLADTGYRIAGAYNMQFLWCSN